MLLGNDVRSEIFDKGFSLSKFFAPASGAPAFKVPVSPPDFVPASNSDHNFTSVSLPAAFALTSTGSDLAPVSLPAAFVLISAGSLVVFAGSALDSAVSALTSSIRSRVPASVLTSAEIVAKGMADKLRALTPKIP